MIARSKVQSVALGTLVALVATLAASTANADSWSSGGFAPQHFDIDLGAPQTISGMSLTVNQSPAGNTVHRIYAGSTPDPTTLVRELSGFTTNGDVLTPTFAPALTGVRYVRVETTVSPSWVAWSSIDFSYATRSTVATTPTFKALSDPHIQQFGYYGCAMNGVGTGDYINEVAPISNVVWVRWGTNDELLAKVQNAHQQGLGVILMVQNLFFPWASSALYADEPSGPRTRFEAVWSLLEPYQSTIKGFYVFDEPFWNNATADGTWTSVPDAQLKSNLTWVAGELHSVAPGVPCIIIFAYTEVSRPEFFSELLPSEIDWIGFDCYLAYGAEGTADKVQGYFDSFVQFKDPSQKIVLVPDAWWNTSPDAGTDSLLAQRLSLYQSFAASSADVVAIYPFLYQTVASQNLFGAQSLPTTTAALTTYFNTLLGQGGGAMPTPAPAPSPALTPAPIPSSTGQITAASNPFGLGMLGTTRTGP